MNGAKKWVSARVSQLKEHEQESTQIVEKKIDASDKLTWRIPHIEKNAGVEPVYVVVVGKYGKLLINTTSRSKGPPVVSCFFNIPRQDQTHLLIAKKCVFNMIGQNKLKIVCLCPEKNFYIALATGHGEENICRYATATRYQSKIGRLCYVDASDINDFATSRGGYVHDGFMALVDEFTAFRASICP
jgi:hypothetical protein